MLQKVTIIGNLGGDPELKYTQSGDAVCAFSVAASEKWTGRDGQKHERTLWFRASAWKKLAEICGQYLKKGSKVFIEGKLTADDNGNPRVWTAKDGTARASFEVQVIEIKFLGGGSGGDNGAVAAAADDMPF